MGVVKLLGQSYEDKENKHNYNKRKHVIYYLKNCHIFKTLDDARKRGKKLNIDYRLLSYLDTVF